MPEDLSLTAPFEPTEWFLVFRRTTTLWLADWFAFGRYRHVSCFGKVAGAGAWVFYDFGAVNMAITVVPDGRANPYIDATVTGNLVVRWVPPVPGRRWRLKPAFLCTTAVAHLAGVPSCALRPDGLLRDCLRAGAEIVIADDEFRTKAEARPAA